jgi:spore coat protein U-like protein
MRFGSGATLKYNIYVDAARSIVWGDGNIGTLVVADAYSLAGPSVTRNYPAYGRIFGNQNAPVGVYTDSIIVTLHF